MARILIVDDTDIVRKALELAVRKMGHEADSTSDPAAALVLAKEHTPDLALLDYRMPGMDGIRLFGELRAMLGEQCPKVLFISATPPDEVKEKTSASPLRPAGFMRKPFHLDDLSKVMREVLAA